ncbi:MAG TPA: PadR family transcriptional regulator [Solirubrobacteraceae bacterium]|jgi:DNA-binding PadR family transcriptional regulator
MQDRFAEEWTGRGGRRKGHRHHHHDHDTANWLFSRGDPRGKRPTPEELEQLVEWRRGMGGGPFGRPGPFGRGGGRARGRGRARRGDVRLALLRLLAEDPANGYQLMQTIEERSQGRWRPSPGSVYPTLAQLEDEGLIRSADAEGARRFEITDAGRGHLETRADEPAPWDLGDDEPSAKDLKSAIAGIAAAAWQVGQAGTDRQRAQASELLLETRRALYRILAEDAADAEQTAADESDESEA